MIRPQRPITPILTGLLLLTASISNAASAGPGIQHCSNIVPDLGLSQPSEATVITADQVRKSDHHYHLDGHVQIEQAEQSVTADTATFNEGSGDLVAEGNIRYLRSSLLLEGSRARINTKQEQGHVENVEFILAGRHARGQAERAILESPTVTTLENVIYSTCEKGSRDWLLKADRIRLDRQTGIGNARHVSLSFMRLPFFYLPYMSFPISDARKTGFLTPDLKQSGSTGIELWLPYYLNIAPNIDATMTPRFTSLRGTQLQGQLRYLSHRHQGVLDLEYLPDDRIYGDTRVLTQFSHATYWSPQWSGHITVSHVSDSDYFTDLGNSLSTASITHLPQLADLRYHGDLWNGGLAVENYQTVDISIPSASRPYKRLPHLWLNRQPVRKPGEMATLFNSDYTHFTRRNSLTGDRVHVVPGLSLPYSTPAVFITPTIKVAHTSYSTDDPVSGQTESRQRTLPILSIDSGVVLERETGRYFQTLEPRLFYLYVPYHDQSQLPLYDAGEADFTFNQLTAENRFNGLDRIGDTNQLSAIVTTRVMDNGSGQQRLSAGLGQAYYFAPRRVTLAGLAADAGPRSDVITQLQWQAARHLEFRLELHPDKQFHYMENGYVELHYNDQQRRIFNVTHRYRRDTMEQSDFSLLWPLALRWHMIGRWNYSQRDKRLLEAFAGVEYQDCCWALRLVSRRYLNGAADDYENSAFIQLELKGMTSIGRGIESLLENGILGYY